MNEGWSGAGMRAKKNEMEKGQHRNKETQELKSEKLAIPKQSNTNENEIEFHLYPYNKTKHIEIKGQLMGRGGTHLMNAGGAHI